MCSNIQSIGTIILWQNRMGICKINHNSINLSNNPLLNYIVLKQINQNTLPQNRNLNNTNNINNNNNKYKTKINHFLYLLRFIDLITRMNSINRKNKIVMASSMQLMITITYIALIRINRITNNKRRIVIIIVIVKI